MLKYILKLNTIIIIIAVNFKSTKEKQMSKKILSLGVALALMLVTAALTFSITMVYSQTQFNQRVYNIKEREAMYSKIAEVDNLIRQNYIGAIDEQKLQDSIATAFVEGVGDRYGQYLTAETYASYLSSNEGVMIGIGVTVKQADSGYIQVVSVNPNTPAEEAGILPDDLIIQVDDLAVTQENYSEAVDKVSGEEGTTVTLVIRRGAEDLAPLAVTRKRIDLTTVTYKMIADNVGYVFITGFNSNTVAQFNTALDAVMSQGAEGLVFDVRNNPGGTVSSVSKILDRLLPEGPIVSAKYKDGTVEVLATSDATEINLPMVVITNKDTASAAELFTQALKDYKKAVSVGDKTTYGKGTMQSIRKLNDGSALNITVAWYNPPKSANYDGVGVPADFEVTLSPDLVSKIAELDISEDTQLKKALELAQTKIKEYQNAMQ